MDLARSKQGFDLTYLEVGQVIEQLQPRLICAAEIVPCADSRLKLQKLAVHPLQRKGCDTSNKD